MIRNNEKPPTSSLSSTLYHQFRQSAKETPVCVADAAELYSRNNINSVVEKVHTQEKKEQAIDNIVNSLRSSKVQDSHGERAHVPKGSYVGQIYSKLLNLLAPDFSVARYAIPIALICVVGVSLQLGLNRTDNTIPLDWKSATLISTGLKDAKFEKYLAPPSNGSQLGLVQLYDFESRVFDLGSATTRLVVSSSLSKENITPLFTAYFKRLAATMKSGAVSSDLISLSQLIANESEAAAVLNSINRLERTVERSYGSEVGEWLKFGQLMESLRLSLLIAAETGDTVSLFHARRMITEYDARWMLFSEQSKLHGLMTKIITLSKQDKEISLTDRRLLTGYTEQIHVLLH